MKLQRIFSAQGRKQKVIFLDFTLLVSNIFVEWTHFVLDSIQAINSGVPVCVISNALDSSRSPSSHRWYEYSKSARNRPSQLKYLPVWCSATSLKYCVPFNTNRRDIIYFMLFSCSHAFTQPILSSYTPPSSAVLESSSQLTYISGTTPSVPKHPALLVVQSVTIAMNQEEIFHYSLLLA